MLSVRRETETCAVLLSGGTDSFILLAMAKKIFSQVIAYSPEIENANNEELDRAKVMAAHLGVPHIVVPISDEDIKAGCELILVSIGRPIRNFSSLIYPALFAAINEKHVFYGLNADILFGDKDNKTQLVDNKYKNLFELIPQFLRGKKVRQILSSLRYGVSRLGILGLGPNNEKHRNKILEVFNVNEMDSPFMQEQLPQGSLVRQFNWSKKLIFDTECRLHMLEIEASAQSHSIRVVTPFYSRELNRISASLSFEQLYGNAGVSILKNFKRDNKHQCKPLIKRIANKYIDADMVYKRKLDFPTPYDRWMSELFNDLPSLTLESMPVQTYWTLYNLLKLKQLKHQK